VTGEKTRSRQSRLLTAAVLGLAVASVLAAFWPGLISWDTSQMLREATHGPVVDWWSGLGTVMLRAWLGVGLGVGMLWAGCVAATVVGFYGCLRLALNRTPAAVVTLLMTVFPPIYGELASFSRDNACMCFTLLAFAALARMTLVAPRGRRHWLGAALACAVIAAICRQNGVVDVCAVVVVGGLHGHPRARLRVSVTLVAALLAGVACYGSISLLQRADGIGRTYATRATMVYDLAGMSVASGHDDFPQRALRSLGPGTASPANPSLGWLRTHFMPLTETTLAGVAEMNVENTRLAARENKILGAAWTRAIEARPLVYLRVRAELSEYMLGLTASGLPAAGGLLDYQGLEHHSNFGHPLAFSGLYRTANTWLGHFLGPEAAYPLDHGWVYLALLIVLGGFLLTRGSRFRSLAAAFLTAAVLNQVLVFFVAPAASFRYILILPPLALLSAVFAIRTRPARSLSTEGVPVQPHPRSVVLPGYAATTMAHLNVRRVRRAVRARYRALQ
jgi:hypothetical protein